MCKEFFKAAAKPLPPLPHVKNPPQPAHPPPPQAPRPPSSQWQQPQPEISELPTPPNLHMTATDRSEFLPASPSLLALHEVLLQVNLEGCFPKDRCCWIPTACAYYGQVMAWCKRHLANFDFRSTSSLKNMNLLLVPFVVRAPDCDACRDYLPLALVRVC